MAWAERTIHEVPDPPSNITNGEEEHINSILKNMPPFIKLSSRRARKTLAKYEAVKQKHIENLRNNPVFKFVMMVSGFTNENMQKYWKGSDVSPFKEGYGPKDVKIDKEEIKLLVRRARENALADLHQFCRPIPAIPMYRRRRDEHGGIDHTSKDNGPQDDPPANAEPGTPPAGTEGPFDPFATNGTAEQSNESAGPFDDNTAQRPNEKGEEGAFDFFAKLIKEDNMRFTGLGNAFNMRCSMMSDARTDDGPRRFSTAARGAGLNSLTKYIYNMSDMEFRDFCIRFTHEDFTKERIFGNVDNPNKIDRYVLGDKDAQEKSVNFPAAKHQRTSNLQIEEEDYNEETYEGNIPEAEDQFHAASHRGPNTGQGVDRVFDESFIYNVADEQVQSYDHDDPYISLPRSDWMQWSNNQTNMHWNETFAPFWFQRYVARWLVREESTSSDNNSVEVDNGQGFANLVGFSDLKPFKNKYGTLFNNLFLKEPDRNQWYRDLTGLRLTKMVHRDQQNEEANNAFFGRTPFEEPLDFVAPLFNERFAYWKHELVLGEYERRTMYEADQWLQKTPWAIGKIYLQPNIYSHMQEAHIAISSRFKKFDGLSLQDWLTSEKHMFFYAKLVALCIRTSAVLSNKKYGLDKAYMRLNLEKRRIMYSLSKMDKPDRMVVRRQLPRASANHEKLWEAYRSARARGDVDEAQRILQALN